MKDLTMIQRFQLARTSFDDTAKQVADNIGCSRVYLYEVLKYPNKNPEIFQKACDYIQKAGVELPDDRRSNHKVTAN